MLVLVLMLVFPAGGTNLIHIATVRATGPRIYLSPSSNTFFTPQVGIGYQFNVTCWVENVAGVAAWEIYLEFNDSVIRPIGWTEPSSDPQYIFYGKTTSANPTPPDTGYVHLSPGKGRMLVYANLFPTPPVQNPSSGSGKLCVLGFNVTAVPTEPGTSLTTMLQIDFMDTLLLDQCGEEVDGVTKENGYYSISYIGNPDLAVVGVSPSRGTAEPGDLVNVRVRVSNLGNTLESCNVTVFADVSLVVIGDEVVVGRSDVVLSAGTSSTLDFTWNTAAVASGNYTTSARTAVVPYETNTANNLLVNGTVRILPVAHDVTVSSVSVSGNPAVPGDTVNVWVDVSNLGSVQESFNVTAYADINITIIGDEVTIGSQPLTLSRKSSTTLHFAWSTPPDLGNYTISARAGTVPGETNTTNNLFVDGMIQNVAAIHDVSVSNILVSDTLAVPGDIVAVQVDVSNLGNVGETFNVTLYADTEPAIIGDEVTVGIQEVNLGKGGSTRLTFYWNTTSLSPGNYTISARAQALPEETNTTDNLSVDGIVQIKLLQDVEVDLEISSPDISFSEVNPTAGQTITISAEIHNLGERNLQNITVRFTDGNLSIGDQQVSSIPKHSGRTASIAWTADREGFHLMKVVVDPDNALVETDEENNEATRSLLVGQFQYFGGIMVSGSANPNETKVGCQVRVQGSVVYNTTFSSGEPVAGATVAVTIAGQQWTCHTLRNGSYSVNVTAPYTQGNYTIVIGVTDGTFWESIGICLDVNPLSSADLALSSSDIVFLPPDPSENDNVSITASIHNIGGVNVTNVLVAVYADGTLIGNATIDIILVGESENIVVSWIAGPRGWRMIEVVIDPENEIMEINKANNRASRNMYVYPPLPDLTPTNIWFSNTSPLVGQGIFIYTIVYNIGGRNVSEVLVGFYDNGQSIGNATIPWMAGKGAFAVASILYSFSSDGFHRVCIYVDPANSIFESDENNNQICTGIIVHNPLPDLTLTWSDITFSNSTPTVGDSVNVYATIHNVGEVDASGVSVEFFADDTRIATMMISQISSNGLATVNASWENMPEGWHRIKVVIDGNNTIQESDEMNNMATRWLYVSPRIGSDMYIVEEDIVFSNTNPFPGEEVTIYATVHNAGEAAAQSVTVWFYVDMNGSWLQLGSPLTISSIPAGENAVVSTQWVASGVGSHVVKVIVDASNETNKNNNVATRAIIVAKHDVAVVSLVAEKIVVCEEFCANLTLTVENKGDIAETFNIVVYVNGTAVLSQSVTLQSKERIDICFAWNASGYGKGNCTLSAYAEPVLGETEIEDNTYGDGIVTITMVGDINADGKVDVKDVYMVAKAYGSAEPPEPSPSGHPWDPVCDINNDGNIDVKDYYIVCKHYGEVDP